ncbi:vitellogenin-2-like [Telopea speciosissima]|uniref:vitellogenin-2-like n=1 Tax=Telopea speciosissima TaxID=54955 RepID=UPI001CC56406|nr:vitellogenin-2-like [Telopea speciosissima]
MLSSNSRTRSSGAVLSYALQKSSSSSSSSTAFASASTSFSPRSTGFFNRSTSSTRTNLCGVLPSSPFVRFSIDRSRSPSRSIAVSPRDEVVRKQSNPLSAPSSSSRKTCMCSPTNHPGSFRCSLHKGVDNHHHHSGSYPSSHRLNARRSAMTNSLVRIGTVEGEIVKRALAALIRPSSHQQKRRASFQPRASRLSLMSKAEDL